jgi:adenosine deaminase
MEDPAVVALAQRNKTPFEVCLTSNCQSGVFPSLSVHPLSQMLDVGLNITLNTDDPSISDITLSHEYLLALNHFGVSWRTLSERVVSAARAAFLLESDKSALIERLQPVDSTGFSN